MDNAYAVLEVSVTASDAEIKAAFRRLARKWHPDKNGGDQEKMTRLNDAFKLIGTPEARHKYDTDNAWVREFDVLSDVFGRPDVARNFEKAPEKNSRAVRGADVTVTVPVDIVEFCSHRMADVPYDRKNTCPMCGGSGRKSMIKCSACKGLGKVRSIDSSSSDVIMKCRRCKGTGFVPGKKCSACGGTGTVKSKKSVRIPVPAYSPSVVKVGLGDGGAFGGENGNLTVVFEPVPNGNYSWNPESGCLSVDIPCRDYEFALGGTVRTHLPDGTALSAVYGERTGGTDAPVMSNEMFNGRRVEIRRSLDNSGELSAAERAAYSALREARLEKMCTDF